MSAPPQHTPRPGVRPYVRARSGPLTSVYVTLRLTAQERERLALEAKARGLSPNGLGRILLERIIHYGLVKSVLDN